MAPTTSTGVTNHSLTVDDQDWWNEFWYPKGSGRVESGTFTGGSTTGGSDSTKGASYEIVGYNEETFQSIAGCRRLRAAGGARRAFSSTARRAEHSAARCDDYDVARLGIRTGTQPVRRSEGLGDTIKQVADATGLSHLAKFYERATGQPCGCHERQKRLNELFPYKSV